MKSINSLVPYSEINEMTKTTNNENNEKQFMIFIYFDSSNLKLLILLEFNSCIN
jgi:hypothetical protein